MSDEQVNEGFDRADEPEEDAVEAHSFDRPIESPVEGPGATEEPPDVEGHGFHQSPIDPKPID